MSSSTLQLLAQEAIDIQDACNMTGLARRFGEVPLAVKHALEAEGHYTGTDQVNQHPIVQLWASKIYELSKMGLSELDQFAAAYAKCRKLAGLD